LKKFKFGPTQGGVFRKTHGEEAKELDEQVLSLAVAVIRILKRLFMTKNIRFKLVPACNGTALLDLFFVQTTLHIRL
jgi:hypothetical protein